jgi:predicted nuclease of restriction endonuclease-like RecB superfamily
MLTKNLLRARVKNGEVVPGLLSPTPAHLETAGRLIEFWRGNIGGRLGDIEDALVPVLNRSRALVVAKGLNKLIQDACTFADPESTAELRQRALAISARLLLRPAATGEAHLAAVAAELGREAEAVSRELYADLPAAAVLTAAPEWKAEALIDAYNMAMCQGLLLSARALTVRVGDSDTGTRRRLLKALRFRRLLALVRSEGGKNAGKSATNEGSAPLVMDISGPASVLDQAARYGLQLALFLPALACARAWSAEAEVSVARIGGGHDRGIFTMGPDLGLVGDSHFLGFVPPEIVEQEAAIAAAVAAKLPGWKAQEPQIVPLPGGELVVPDMQFHHGGRVVAVECFHRWHATALARRLEQVGRKLAPRLAIGVDRALAKTKEIAPWIAGEAFVRQGFLFSDIPTARAVVEIVGRLGEV